MVNSLKYLQFFLQLIFRRVFHSFDDMKSEFFLDFEILGLEVMVFRGIVLYHSFPWCPVVLIHNSTEGFTLHKSFIATSFAHRIVSGEILGLILELISRKFFDGSVETLQTLVSSLTITFFNSQLSF